MADVTTPMFFYYPDPDGSLETIDLGEGLSKLKETPIRDVSDAYDGARALSRVVHAGGYVDRTGMAMVHQGEFFSGTGGGAGAGGAYAGNSQRGRVSGRGSEIVISFDDMFRAMDQHLGSRGRGYNWRT